MNIIGYSSNLYVWEQRYKADGRESSLETIIRDCAEAGLDAVEVAPRPETVALIRENGLNISGTYLGLALHEPYEALPIEGTVLSAANGLAANGGSDFILNANPKGEWTKPRQKTEEELKRQGDNLSRIARLVQPLGLKVSMHNHAAASLLAEGDLRSVVDYADPAVGLCVDTGWAHTAGHDPIDWVLRYPERITALHLRNQIGSTPTEDLLEGEIDINKLIRILNDNQYCGWMGLELWHPQKTNPQRSMIEDVKRSIQYLKSLVQ